MSQINQQPCDKIQYIPEVQAVAGRAQDQNRQARCKIEMDACKCGAGGGDGERELPWDPRGH